MTVSVEGFPWTWDVVFDVATPALRPPPGAAAFPREGRALVRLAVRASADEAVQAAAHVLVREIPDDGTLAAAAAGVRRRGQHALFLLGPRVGADAANEAQGASPDVALCRTADGPRAAAGALDGLFRRRLLQRLLQNAAEATARARQAAVDLSGSGLANLLAANQPALRVAPLRSLEQLHAGALAGAVWAPEPKCWAELGVSPPTLRRLLAEVPDVVARLAAGAPEVPLKVLVVEDEPLLARVLDRLVRSAAKELGTRCEVDCSGTAGAARERMREKGFPDVAWVDVRLETPRAGIELLGWMRAEGAPTVVLGKTGGASVEDIRECTRLGAVAVWSGARVRTLGASDGSLVEAAGPLLASAVRLAAAVRAARDGAEAVRALEAELSTPMPDCTGRPGVTLAELRRAAVRLALAATSGNVAAAARELGIGPRRLLALADRRRARAAVPVLAGTGTHRAR